MGAGLRILFVLLLFASCATPDHRLPSLDSALLASERERVVEDAMETALARRARVYDLAWPVLTANVELCPDTAPRAGLVLADRPLLARMAGGIDEDRLEEIGIAEGLRVLHVMAGSPAAQAGLPSGGFVDAVNGEAEDDPGKAAKALRDALEEEREATLTVAGETYRLEGARACDVAVKIGTSQAINADAVSGITIYTGLIRSLSDEALQAVIAHELAHVALEHPRKYVRNAVLTGGVVTGPVLYALGSLTDRVAGVIGRPFDRSLAGRALGLVAPWSESFEAEADYVGLYLFARAGGDLSAAAEVYDTFSRESPASISVAATHPVTPERLARAAATIAEIEAKREAGLPLLPERRDGKGGKSR
ncbi:M48 family metalloprotease [Parvularcula oceani]|uniref:M48 family metalloprotease n=1 Tax=Parvularcula oceani TaxID=1247963 RepID=UPI0004E1D5A1|nr:M48 family metalloprotease [Parvularcula oceani]